MLTATYIFVCALKAFRDVWSNDRLLNVVEQLIGPDIIGHPVWNLRTKTPQNEATTVPWHQGIPPPTPSSIIYSKNASSCIIYGVSYLILYSLINLRCWLSWQFLIQSDAADCLDSIIGRQRVERMHAGWNHNYIKILHLLSSVKIKRAQPIDNFCDVNFAVDGQRAQNRKGWHPPVLPWRHVVRDARGRRNEEDVR